MNITENGDPESVSAIQRADVKQIFRDPLTKAKRSRPAQRTFDLEQKSPLMPAESFDTAASGCGVFTLARHGCHQPDAIHAGTGHKRGYLTHASAENRDGTAAERNLATKRLFDLSVVLVGAIVWIPAVVICAFALLILNGRPVFYPSFRHVSRDRLIRVFKFRTMVKDADKILNRETVPITSQRFLNIPINSPAYTRVGRIVERIHFTELPQFFHVLRGTMSIVGSRPLPSGVFQALLQGYPLAGARFDSPAGMTGLAQLIGREYVSDEDRLSLEAAYCQVCLTSYSPLLDVEILTKTLLTSSGLMAPMTLQDTQRLIEKYRQASR